MLRLLRCRAVGEGRSCQSDRFLQGTRAVAGGEPGAGAGSAGSGAGERRRSEEHTSELQSHLNLVCRLLLEKKKKSSPDASTKVVHTRTMDSSTYRRATE